MSKENLKVKLNIPSHLLEGGNWKDIEDYLTSCLKNELIEQGFDIVDRGTTSMTAPVVTPSVSADDFEHAGINGMETDSASSEVTSISSSVEIIPAENDSQPKIADVQTIVERSEKLQKRIEHFINTQAEFFRSLREENQSISIEIQEIKKLTENALKAAAEANNLELNDVTIEEEATEPAEIREDQRANVAGMDIEETAPAFKIIPESYEFVRQLPDHVFRQILKIIAQDEPRMNCQTEIDFTGLQPATLQEIDRCIVACLGSLPWDYAIKSIAPPTMEALFGEDETEPLVEELHKTETVLSREPNVSNEQIWAALEGNEVYNNQLKCLHNMTVATINNAISQNVSMAIEALRKMFEDRKTSEKKTEMMNLALKSAMSEIQKEIFAGDHITKKAKDNSTAARRARVRKISFIALVCQLFNANYLDFSSIETLLNDFGINPLSIGKAVNIDCLSAAQDILDQTQEKLVAQHEEYYCSLIGLFFTLKEEVDQHVAFDDLAEIMIRDFAESAPESAQITQQPRPETVPNTNVSYPNDDIEMQEGSFDEEMEGCILRVIQGEQDPESLVLYDYSTIRVKQIIYNMVLQAVEKERISVELVLRVIKKMFEDRKTIELKTRLLSTNLFAAMSEYSDHRYTYNNIKFTVDCNSKVAQWARTTMLRFISIVAELYNNNYIDLSFIQKLHEVMGIKKESFGYAKNGDTILIAKELLRLIQDKVCLDQLEYYMGVLELIEDLQTEVANVHQSRPESSARTSTQPLRSTPDKSQFLKRPISPAEPTETDEEKLRKEMEELKLDEEEASIVLAFCKNLATKNIEELGEIRYMKLGLATLKLITEKIWNLVLNSRLTNEVPTAVKLLEVIFSKLSMNYTKEEAYLEIVQNMVHEKFDAMHTPFVATKYKELFNLNYNQQYETMMRLIRFTGALCNAEYLPVSFVKRCVEKLGISYATTPIDIENSSGVKIAIVLVELVQDKLVEQHLEYLFYIQPLLETLSKEDTDNWDFNEEGKFVME